MEFARPQTAPHERLALAPLVEEITTLLANDCLKRSVRVEVAVPSELVVCGDRTRLKQVLLNLCLNSLDAMEQQGGVLRVQARQDAGQMVVRVEDAGSGIAPEALARLFEPFFTTKKTGTGLGLAVVQGIIHDHGGTIEITSELEKGTRVTVRLPQADASGSSVDG